MPRTVSQRARRCVGGGLVGDRVEDGERLVRLVAEHQDGGEQLGRVEAAAGVERGPGQPGGQRHVVPGERLRRRRRAAAAPGPARCPSRAARRPPAAGRRGGARRPVSTRSASWALQPAGADHRAALRGPPRRRAGGPAGRWSAGRRSTTRISPRSSARSTSSASVARIEQRRGRSARRTRPARRPCGRRG